MNDTLIGLYELQHVDTELDELIASRGELPLRVDEMREALVERENILSDIERFIHERESQLRSIESDVQDSREKLEKYKSQQFDVKTTREYDAITFQIEDANRRLNEGLEQMGRHSVELENARTDADAARADVTGLKTEFDESKKMLDEMLAETAEEEKALLAKRTVVVGKVDANFLAMYERVRPAKNGLAVVAVHSGVCGGCYNAIPRQLVLELNRGGKHTVCEYCGRIIVGEPIAAAVDGEAQPVSHEVEEEE
ncbi:MAG TPA: C4-type zinc ribbon domain-containing protein [Candidatus Kapabacteria bacterium]|nr:C4-type zinc ribbon domain-containing protein [Candidatus Kapabacteria bacterium]